MALGDNLAIMKTLVVLLSLTLPVAAFAQAAPADGALRPTRMQMCQHELKDVPEAQRKTQFNTCLQRRAKAEVAMERDCRRESQAIKGSKPRETDELRRNATRLASHIWCGTPIVFAPYCRLVAPSSAATAR